MDLNARLTEAVSERDHRQGSDEAPLTLVEYGDFQCPYCGAAYPVVKRIQETLGDRLRFVFRNFPLTQSHPFAMVTAEAAEAAALQNKYWEMHDRLFEKQARLRPDRLLLWATQLGMDAERFQFDMKSAAVANRIKDDRASGIRSGVNGTPTFFINGARYDDSPDYESLLQTLQETVVTL